MSLTIVLEKQVDGVPMYMPGETIKGSVIADMEEATTCDCKLHINLKLHWFSPKPFYIQNHFRILDLTLTVQGRADVEIIEFYSASHTDKDGKSVTRDFEEVFRAEEIYLSATLSLLGETKLPKGPTVLPFQYSLPVESVPCTFEASHGSVVYDILVHMKRPILSFDIRGSIDFTVGPLLDLNNCKLTHFGPTQFPVEEYIGGCCCFSKGELIRLDVSVPKRHFIPGEVIIFSVVTENKTNFHLLSGMMQLVMTVDCRAQGRVRGDEKIVAQIAGPSVPSRSSKTWEVSNLIVPVVKPIGLPPTRLGGCNIIDVQYILRYVAETDGKGCCSNGCATAVIPIIIGTISLNQE